MDALRFLLALENVEERLTRDRFDYNALFPSFLVLLRLFHFLFGRVLALLPVNRAALHLNRLICVAVGNGRERQLLVGEEVVRFEGHRDGEFGVGQLDLAGV